MELSCSNITKFLMFFYILGNGTFRPKLKKKKKKKKKIPPQKTPYILALYFSFSYIFRNGNLHFSAQGQKNKKNSPRENLYFLRQKLFLYFGKWEP